MLATGTGDVNNETFFSFERIGLFLVYTLSPSSVDESQTCLDNVLESQGNGKT